MDNNLKPIYFDESNKIIKASKTPIYKDDNHVVVCYSIGGWRQRIKFLFSNKIFVAVQTETLPPISLTTTNPILQ